ncbi:Uncharacterized conserved protein [Listeria grayi]|uniref:Threonine/Serine exporter ThrE domain-containing protein n=3 Tax=Listeria grayi TaxID=1641 RepID=D7UZQ6_LISGR|nr:threonine/serine exporter family protein [Listeria grayi]EFI82901.1 hypothetical protein HMPREF0556_11586 [Listeria grayi DSM 20601]EUJ28896.1 hypothetical protein LMUR_04595 [Listeria grayi FSL F6-1183]STY44113.1 Uncharacterized conserved protein [Listeria grayi]VEI35773.1 Uncharacterized conserved protein [Listeria grayi]
MGEIAYHLFFSFISSVTFAVLCNVPKKAIFTSGIIGMIGWIGYFEMTKHGYGVFLASLVCSLLLAVAAQIAAHRFKMPLTVYFVPGLVPVVPGITFYDAFRTLLLGDYSAAGFVFLNVGYAAVGLAVGLVTADILCRYLLIPSIKRLSTK